MGKAVGALVPSVKADITNLFGGGKKISEPVIPPPAEMPVPGMDSAEVMKQKKKKMAEIMRRGGRQSTIITGGAQGMGMQGQGSDTLG